jgi:transposase
MGGKKPFSLAEHADWINARMAEKPDITGRELLAEPHERQVEASYFAVWNFLDHAGLSFKKLCLPVNRIVTMWPGAARYGSAYRARQILAG